MFETGLSSIGEIAEEARGLTCASAARAHNRHELKTRLCGGVAACVFMLALFAPVSIDFDTGEIAVNTALAGNGDGNYGKGKGNGGPNEQNPGKGNGGDGDEDDGDEDDGDEDDGDEDDGDDGDGDTTPPVIPVTEEDGDKGSGPDAAADMAEADFAEAIDAIADSPAEGPMAGTPSITLPTISQLFSMGDEATVSAENELELIANGWDTAN